MDIVYIVSHDHYHAHLELRYSMRSMQKHLDSIGRMFIVGERPAFLKHVIHIPADDIHKDNDARNIYEKILLACNDRRVGRKFLCCSDDYFLLKDFSSENFPYYYEGDIETVFNRLSATGTYKPYVGSTLNALKEKGLPTKFFNVHSPIIYDKKLFKDITGHFDWTVKKGYIAKSIYCNASGIEGEFIMDNKIGTPKTDTAIVRRISDPKKYSDIFFSTNRWAINDEMKAFFETTFPDKSKWET